LTKKGVIELHELREAKYEAQSAQSVQSDDNLTPNSINPRNSVTKKSLPRRLSGAKAN
jgi:hypothetical protein